MNKKILGFAFVLLLVAVTIVLARSSRPAQIPNGDKSRCLNCHNSTSGGSRNSFGTEVENNFLSEPGASGQVLWGPALAAMDSDGDGFSNGVELQDPNGDWRPGAPAPGDRSLVTNPGDATDFPTTTGIIAVDPSPEHFELLGNYPNPFNPSTTIHFVLLQTSLVRLEVYNALGARVKVLLDSYEHSGTYEIVWNGNNEQLLPVESGVYYYRLTAGSQIQVSKMILQK